MPVEHVDILLVEDNPDDAELARHAFRRNHPGRSVAVARDGQEALDYLFGEGAFTGRSSAERPRLVLLDLKLPRMSGLEVLRRLRGDPRTRTLPVVMLTSSQQEADILGCYQEGANSYLVKPVDFDEFSALSRVLGEYWLVHNRPAPA